MRGKNGAYLDFTKEDGRGGPNNISNIARAIIKRTAIICSPCSPMAGQEVISSVFRQGDVG